jgi:hypothetical protein
VESTVAAPNIMLSLASTSSSAAALERADSSARAAARAAEAKPAGTAVAEAPAAAGAQAPKAPGIAGTVAGVADGLSTVAAIGVTVGSIPAALCRMRDIAVASNSGTLSDSERTKLRSEYMDLNHQVVNAIGESGRTLAVTAPKDAASSQDGTKDSSRQHADQGAGRGGQPAARVPDEQAAAAGAAETPQGAAAAPPAPGARPQTIEAARPAVFAQFRQQAAAPRAQFSVRA